MRRSLIVSLMVGCVLLAIGPPAWAEPEVVSEQDAIAEREAVPDPEAAFEPEVMPESDPEASSSNSGSIASQPNDLLPGARIVQDGRPMGLQEAVALSIQNNLDVQVERFEPLIVETDRDAAWGAYDPMISADGFYDVQKTRNTFLSGLNPIPNLRDREQGGGVGIDQLLPYVGATLGVRFESSETVTRSTFQQLDPRYDSSLFLTARVPLLRGLLWNEAWTNVKVSSIAAESSLEGFRASLMDNVRGTVDSYWNLVAARDQVRVAQKSLETSRALLDQTKTQYEVGVVSRVEVVEAEAGVANREFDLIRNANNFRNAQDQLIDAVLGTELSALTTLQVVPTENPESYDPRLIDVQSAVEKAFRDRPELRRVNHEIEQGELALKFAKNQRLPQFDAEVRFGFIGVSGEGNTAAASPPPDSAYGDSTEDFFTGQGNENLRVQGTFSIPFPNTTARKRVVRDRLDLRRSKTRRVRLQQTIILEVRSAARLLAASGQGIDAAERRRLAAEEQLRAERIRLEHGESTPFEVLQRESDLVEAESQKINALQTYRSAEAGLERAQGTILDSYGIVVDDARRLTR